VRRTVLALLLASIVPAAAATAVASPRFSATFRLSYLTRAPGSPAGQALLMTWSDRGAPNEVPKAIKRIDLRFPPGTRFDTSALARCRASDSEIKAKGSSACPAATRLGRGHTTGVSTSGAEFTTDVTLFNARGQIIVLVTLQGVVLTEFRDRVKGRTITIEPALPPGVSLKRLKLRIGRHSGYMRAPPSCPASRKWTTVARFAYADRSVQTLRSASPCRQR
jgi:hypothetical protein